MIRALPLVALLATASHACDSTTADEAIDAGAQPADSGASSPDASADAAPLPCQAADDCDWIEAYQDEIVAKLSGDREISPGLSLDSRRSSAERNATRDFLVAQLEALGLTARLHDYGGGANVYATLESSEVGAPVILMGAHFDGVTNCPAAADNATGTALVLTAARFFSGLQTREYTLMFVFFDQEELGLIGSGEFAAKLRDDGTVVEAVHNFDMISWDEDEDGAAELWSPATELQDLYELVGEERGIPIRVHAFRSSDHASFIDEGFDAVGVSEEFVSDDHTPHYHQSTDSYDKVDFEFLASITRLVLTVVTRTP